MKIISWNLLRRTGAAVKDVAELIQQEKPDLVLMQEATSQVIRLPDLAGGTLFHEPMDRRIYGLAAWSPHEVTPGETFTLPVSRMPGRLPPRIAQILHVGEITFANVHLSHGQWLNRWQLHRLCTSLTGPAAIIGDYNAVGPTILPGFRDIGPRERTHMCGRMIPLRLDRCLARSIRCVSATTLARGASDHHPIVLHLRPEHHHQAWPVAAE
ncbi:endonuclease/exonuclease/phosphatase family protein [Iodidimonas sp. SYSU 1G8]|uniref:endonuclease/exonuclease/phosphatase family protein n=1 Tax=Iodidimonas sp. SYSU 1G8 TaxID=3133967 RepID=UPI0031FEF666